MHYLINSKMYKHASFLDNRIDDFIISYVLEKKGRLILTNNEIEHANCCIQYLEI